jgi:hypothetical protein
MHASVGSRYDGWLRLAGVFTEFDRDEQRPLRRSAKRASRKVDSLQRDPDSEEVEAPLVEPGVPHRVFVVAVVVDRSTPPASARGRKWSAPVGMWRLAGTPGCRSIAPRSSVEVTALVVAVPGTAGTTRSVVTGTTRSVVTGTTRSAWPTGAMHSGPARPTGTARSMVTRPAWPTGSGTTRSGTTRPTRAGAARSRTTRSARSRTTWPVASSAAARVVWGGCGVACRRRGAVAAAGSRARSGAGRTSAHAQRGCPQGAGDGCSGHQLLQFHRPSPVSWVAVDTCPRRTER